MFYIWGLSIWNEKNRRKENYKTKIIRPKLLLFNVEKKKNEYFLEIQKYVRQKIIKEEDIKNDPLAKQFIELLIRDILHSNPKLEFYKGLFVLNKNQKIKSDKFVVNFYPGFTTSFIETNKGNYLNVTLKNKIIQQDTILDYLNENNYQDTKNQESIAKN